MVAVNLSSSLSSPEADRLIKPEFESRRSIYEMKSSISLLAVLRRARSVDDESEIGSGADPSASRWMSSKMALISSSSRVLDRREMVVVFGFGGTMLVVVGVNASTTSDWKVETAKEMSATVTLSSDRAKRIDGSGLALWDKC